MSIEKIQKCFRKPGGLLLLLKTTLRAPLSRCQCSAVLDGAAKLKMTRKSEFLEAQYKEMTQLGEGEGLKTFAQYSTYVQGLVSPSLSTKSTILF